MLLERPVNKRAFVAMGKGGVKENRQLKNVRHFLYATDIFILPNKSDYNHR